MKTILPGTILLASIHASGYEPNVCSSEQTCSCKSLTMGRPGNIQPHLLVRHKRSKSRLLVRLERQCSGQFASCCLPFGSWACSRPTHLAGSSTPPARGFGHLCIPRNPGPQARGLVAKAKNMKPLVWIGILLIVLGGLALAYQGFTYTHREKVLDVGPIHATADRRDHISVPPILGGLALVGGIVLVFVGAKKGS